jgi:hypothetical protein
MSKKSPQQKKTRQEKLRKLRQPLGQNQVKTRKAVAQSLGGLSLRCDQLDKNVAGLANAVGSVWANQKELTKSENLLDEQFAVLTRLTIISLNVLVNKHNLAMEMIGAAMGGMSDVSDLTMPTVDYEDVNLLFEEWAKFRSRPDFRDHMRAWFMGDDLSKLPPPPEPEAKEGESDVDDSGKPGREGEEAGGHEVAAVEMP